MKVEHDFIDRRPVQPDDPGPVIDEATRADLMAPSDYAMVVLWVMTSVALACLALAFWFAPAHSRPHPLDVARAGVACVGGDAMIAPVTYYRLYRVDQVSNDRRIGTAAVLFCATCGTTISGMGGGEPAVCQRCYSVLESGEGRGCIVWGDNKPADWVTP